MNILKSLFDSSGRTRLAVAGLIAVVGFSIVLCWMMMRAEPIPLPSKKNQRYLGTQIAQQIKSLLPQGELVLLVLFAGGREPYSLCIESLQDSLDAELELVGRVYAVDEGIYNDDDYSASIDYALGRYPKAKLLCIVSAGSVLHAGISPRLGSFLQSGGKLVLVGQVMQQDSPFVHLARQGYARIIARRSGWLKLDTQQAIAEPDSAEEYFEQNYVVLSHSRSFPAQTD